MIMMVDLVCLALIIRLVRLRGPLVGPVESVPNILGTED